jgi:hypothetical protein
MDLPFATRDQPVSYCFLEQKEETHTAHDGSTTTCRADTPPTHSIRTDALEPGGDSKRARVRNRTPTTTQLLT